MTDEDVVDAALTCGRPIAATAGMSHPACSFPNMPIARIRVTAVSDEGDNVIVWGRPEHAPDDSEPIGFAFQAKGEQADARLAERASRLARGTEAVIDYSSVTAGWKLAKGLSAS